MDTCLFVAKATAVYCIMAGIIMLYATTCVSLIIHNLTVHESGS